MAAVRSLEVARSLRLSTPFSPRVLPTPRRRVPISSFTRTASTSTAPPPAGTPFSTARLLAISVAVAAGSTFALTHTGEPLQASTDAVTGPIDFSDPLSALEPSVLMRATSHLHELPVAELMRQYVVFLGSSQSYLVTAGPWLLHKLEWCRENVPFVGELAWNAFALGMRGTFYSVFVAGGTVPECQPLVNNLADHGIGCLLNYSAEAMGEKPATGGINVENLDESRNAVRAMAEFESPAASGALITAKDAQKYTLKTSLFAIKLTGLIHEPQLLARATSALVESSAYQRGAPIPSTTLFPESPLLSDEDKKVLGDLYQGLRRVAAEAQTGGVRLLVDAEQSWFQPAIDRYVDLLSEEFNKVTRENSADSPAIPIIYNTYQAYLRTSPPNMKAAIERAEAGGYSFGAKLVRGAYVDSERRRHAESGASGDCVVWNNKRETDDCYDSCALLLERRIAREIKSGKAGQPGTGAIFASHNGPSMKKVLASLREDGLARNVGDGIAVDERVRGRISFAQLFGMSDNLTSTLLRVLAPSTAGTTSPTCIPFVNKYVPYATVDQALPYLIRRASENQAILRPDPSSGRGGAAGERKAIGKEIRSRVGLTF